MLTASSVARPPHGADILCARTGEHVVLERHLGWQHKVSLRNLRFWLLLTAGVLSHSAGKTAIKLAVPERESDWWRRLWEKILSPFPNCNAVENHPAFTSQSA